MKKKGKKNNTEKQGLVPPCLPPKAGPRTGQAPSILPQSAMYPERQTRRARERRHSPFVFEHCVISPGASPNFVF